MEDYVGTVLLLISCPDRKGIVAGAKPYEQALDRGVKIIGATAHYVTENLERAWSWAAVRFLEGVNASPRIVKVYSNENMERDVDYLIYEFAFSRIR